LTRLDLISAILAATALAGAARADIIDRIAASVGSRVITRTDLEREIRVTAFQDGIKPDLSPEHKKAVLQAMIEQKLIEVELENSRFPLPDLAELTPAIEQFKKAHFKDEADYRQSLATAGITEQDFQSALLWQRTLLLFIQVRFESGVQLNDQEVADYFDKTVKPAAEAAHPGVPVVLEDYRTQIEAKLTGERANRQMDTWLAEAKRRTEITIHPEALQ
jgi:hypothetical protein